MKTNPNRISIKDIAKTLKVSITTISFVLNGRAVEKRISDDRVKEILDYIKKIGYKPSLFARGLRTGKSSTIGLILENISEPFFAQVVQVIEDQAEKHGYQVFCSITNGEIDKKRRLIYDFNERKVDGYIIANPEGISKEILALRKQGVPVVLLSNAVEPLKGINSVIVDNFEIIYSSVSHLLENGYREIAFVISNEVSSQMQERIRGYQDVVADYNLIPRVKIIDCAADKKRIKDIISFLEQNQGINALIFSDYSLGLIGLKAIQSMNMEIPSDFAVLVFDDGDAFEVYNPSISAIRQPTKKIAEEAMAMLIKEIGFRNSKSSVVTYKSSLMIRESTAVRIKSISQR